MCHEARFYTTSSAQIIVPKNIFILSLPQKFFSQFIRSNQVDWQ
jgi:predicted lactoylglutathione lyase